MKLNFNLCTMMDSTILEARLKDKIYTIHQKDEMEFYATLDGEQFTSGDLYECIDACNNHAHKDATTRKLDLDKELDGCCYTIVNELSFKDHNDEIAVSTPRRFRSVEEVRSFIQENSKDAIVYVYTDSLTEYNLGDIWYHLRCAVRRK